MHDPATTEQDSRLFEPEGRLCVRRTGVAHRNDEYDDHGFDVLLRMQRKHFWYRGRHRFLGAALQAQLARRNATPATLSAIDLGAGCGGWIEYLLTHTPLRFGELAAADSSPRALQAAAALLAPEVKLFQADLLDLGWQARWDVVFLLDVLEHIPDQVAVLRQVQQSLKPGGLLFLTAPALRGFWSYNDELVHHQRRYARHDLATLAETCGLQLLEARYFMFFLSPLLYLSRLCGPRHRDLSPAQAAALLARTHRVPAAPVNALLHGVFACETPLGLHIPFPWGTSVLGVFRK